MFVINLSSFAPHPLRSLDHMEDPIPKESLMPPEDPEIEMQTKPRSLSEIGSRPRTALKRPLTAPKRRKDAYEVSKRQNHSMDRYVAFHCERKQRNYYVMDRYENQITAFETEKFMNRFSPQRRVEFCSKTKDRRLVEQIARQRRRKRPTAMFFE